jgi:hypothetical protein
MRLRIVGTRFALTRVLLAVLGVSGAFSVSMLANPLPALARPAHRVVNGCAIVADPTPIDHTRLSVRQVVPRQPGRRQPALCQPAQRRPVRCQLKRPG